MTTVPVNDNDGQEIVKVKVGDTKQQAINRIGPTDGVLKDKDGLGLTDADLITSDGAPYEYTFASQLQQPNKEQNTGINKRKSPEADIQSIVDQSLAKAIKAMASTRPDTRTNAQFYQDLQSEHKVENSGDEFAFPESTKLWIDAWYKSNEPTFPPDDADESGDDGTQAFFDSEMNAIKEVIDRNNGKLPVRKAHRNDRSKFLQKPHSWKMVTSLPQVHVHNTPPLHRRKFDGYTTQCGHAGPLSITFPTELKGALPRHRGFPDDQAGQILDMATQLMEYEQRNRGFMFAGLTDGYRWMFFKIIRVATGYRYQQSTVYQGLVGWRHFLGILCAPLYELGVVTPEISMVGLSRIRLECVLGIGGSSVVYRAKIRYAQHNSDSEADSEDDAALVKVYHASHLESRESEAWALSLLAEGKVNGVPKLVLDGKGTSSYHSCGAVENILVVQPIGTPVLPVKGGQTVRGKHLRQLVWILQQAHVAGLQHRDIKPDNIYLVGDSLLLNDWGSATTLEGEAAWQGTPGFCDPPTFNGSGNVRDLRAAVRTAWSLVRNQFPLTDKEDPNFWSFLEKSEEQCVWTEAWVRANEANYEKLANVLGLTA